MPAFLFAYGTLQPGAAPPEAADLVKALQPVGRASVAGVLYDLGDYPGAIFDKDAQSVVNGTVYRLPASPYMRRRLLERLDEYEGTDQDRPEHGLFVRRKMPVAIGNGRLIDCWAYQYNRTEKHPPGKIISGGTYLCERRTTRHK